MKAPDFARAPVVISYSGGSSSEWMIEAVIQGVIPRPERLAVVFADTGWEHDWTYAAVEEVEARCIRAGIPFLRCAADESLPAHLLSIESKALTRADHPPVWIEKAGGGRGQAMHRCTAIFKVAPMRRAVTQWLVSIGAPHRVTKWIGFAAEEIARAHKAVGKQDVLWERLEFPAIRRGVGRTEQRLQLERWTGRAPRFSMCIGCPWKTPRRWRETSAADLPGVYAVDESIRDLSAVGLTDGDAFLCDRLVSVEQLIRKGDRQLMLPDMERYCDGGSCFL